MYLSAPRTLLLGTAVAATLAVDESSRTNTVNARLSPCCPRNIACTTTGGAGGRWYGGAALPLWWAVWAVPNAFPRLLLLRIRLALPPALLSLAGRLLHLVLPPAVPSTHGL
eukprot:6468658-Amphidinium_carterae.1